MEWWDLRFLENNVFFYLNAHSHEFQTSNFATTNSNRLVNRNIWKNGTTEVLGLAENSANFCIKMSKPQFSMFYFLIARKRLNLHENRDF